MLGCPLAPAPAPACPAVRDRLWPQTLSISCAHAWRLPARSAGSPEGGKGAGGAGALADSASKRKLNFAGAADAESRQMTGQPAQLKAQDDALSKALVEAKACLASSEFHEEQAQIKARKFQVYAESDPGVLAEEVRRGPTEARSRQQDGPRQAHDSGQARPREEAPVRRKERRNSVAKWVIFLLSFASPHPRPMGRACVEADANQIDCH